ncbi:formimidoylglutamase [Marivirga arenosa]|uniref:Formimidoylglutamase n=1 Tax=Marivirga arenosa TaxID=3059076 RepID=A0AA51RCX9_9BACT|nr:formimidoylglutamase [Marivirga sp. ABR2-2]WMN07084.1 formimidoylglutamase [Marivirga sp. ABR2-2]
MDIANFKYLDKETLFTLTHKREGEIKIGEKISYGSDFENSTARYVIIGIEESIGVKGNLGKSGTHTAWNAFLNAFLNVQNTDRLNGDPIHILGSFQFQEIFQECESTEDYREKVSLIDDSISPLIEKISLAGKRLIIIGGSHANAYPIIKGVSQAKNSPVSVINMDAHADFRKLEGRHSGNPFSSVRHEGFLGPYHILGLHENYNSQTMLEEMSKQKDIQWYFYEDIYLRNKISFDKALHHFIENTKGIAGIELDMDSVENVLSSAMTPTGFSALEARKYAYNTAYQLKPSYFHICEAAAKLDNGLEDPQTGKLLSYLVTDFIKGLME